MRLPWIGDNLDPPPVWSSAGPLRGKRFGRPRLICALLIAGILCMRSAAAQKDNGAGHDVEIVLAGGEATTNATLKTMLRRSLDGLGARSTFTEVAAVNLRELLSVRPAAVDVWIDLGVAASAAVYITEGTHVFARRFDLRHGLDPVALDLLDVVVTSSVETILSGRQLGVPKEEFTRSLEKPPETATVVEQPAIAQEPSTTPSETRSATVISVSTAYEASLFDATTLSHGADLLVDVRDKRWWCRLGLHGRLPLEVNAGGERLHVAPEGARAAVGNAWTIPAAQGWTLIAGLGAGVDRTHVEPRPGSAPVIPGNAFTTWDFLLRPAATIERRFTSLRLAATAGLDLVIVGANYVVQTTSLATRPVWTPWRARPFLSLEVGLSF